MKQPGKSVQKKIRWNKQQLSETVQYIRVYISALKQLLPHEERQTLYMIAKIFTDATVEVNRQRFHVARYLFEKGERYMQDIPEKKSLLRFFLYNVYDRSKSLYYYRTGDSRQAISLISNTLHNNRMLEARGLSFLLFDRISQYHNLSKVYFSSGERLQALDVLSDCLIFLMTGRAMLLQDLNDHHIREYDADLTAMRYSLMCQLLFETTEKLQRENNAGIFWEQSSPFFKQVLEAAGRLIIRTPVEGTLKKWLLITELFYSKQFHAFSEAATLFVAHEPIFYQGTPLKLLVRFSEYSKRI